MGKSTASCFKIISCGSDSVDHDDLQTPESKGSSDRRGWSFRKRSARHRVLSNSVTSEAPSSANKETPESTAANFQVQPDLTVPEKNSVIQLTEEKTEFSSQVDSKLSGIIAAKEDDCRANATPDEHSIVTIQAAIRGLLAQQVLLKQKNIIKLQAAVRGHLVRNHAVGTLRCVQAIIKMQALVRARRARRIGEGSGDLVNQSERSGDDDKNLTLLSKREAKPNGSCTYVSIEKLLSNAFARQLMGSTPRTKPINIKCDPLKSDSSWNWLERWMSVSSVSDGVPQESGSAPKQHTENHGHIDGKELVPSDCCTESRDFKSEVVTSIEASENDGTLISDEANNLDSHSNKSLSPSSSHSELHIIDQSNSTCDVTKSVPSEMEETDLVEVVEVKFLPEKKETGNEDVPDSENISTEQPETEVKKLSRKASNPAFVAAQSKFEELGSAATSTKLTTLSSNDPGVESNSFKVSPSTDQPLLSKDTPLADSAVSIAPAVQIGGSECGTELSISSTLDSPDRSEAGVNDIGQETKVADEIDRPRSKDNLLQADKKTSLLETDPSCTNTNELNRYESINSSTADSPDSVIAADSPQLEIKPEAVPSVPQLELESEASNVVNKSSPASPRNHITVPDSQATPSSQVSVKSKKSRGGKSESNRKNKSSSGDKNLKNRDQDSASKNSLEHLQEHKTGKGRNSFGSAKPDHGDQEPRDSSSSSSLPSYMQATESAKAKAIANGSPRSSPDVHEKDIYIKKRHSLPVSNERQGSPRIQRSLSQAQQNVKVTASQSPQDRKWRR